MDRPNRAPANPKGSLMLGIWQLGRMGGFFASMDTDGTCQSRSESIPESAVTFFGDDHSAAPSLNLEGSHSHALLICNQIYPPRGVHGGIGQARRESARLRDANYAYVRSMRKSNGGSTIGTFGVCRGSLSRHRVRETSVRRPLRCH